jgi:hypothetical protein
LCAIAGLGWRDGRRWSTGLLAALFYALAYYGTGFIHTAQREGFAVLPLLLALHVNLAAEKEKQSSSRSLLFYGLVGVFGFASFAIKPTLGLCFGVLWIDLLIRALRKPENVVHKWAGIGSMSFGFILAAAGAVLLLKWLNWWEAFYPVLTRAAVPGYIIGPENIKIVLPYLLSGIVLVLALWVLVWRPVDKDTQVNPENDRGLNWNIPLVIAVVFGFMVITYHWGAWGNIARRTCGLLLPAIGSILALSWRHRSRTWRLAFFMASAVFAGMVMQGWFFLYHFFPLFAFTAYLAAYELIDALRQSAEPQAGRRMWALVCLAAVTHLAVDHWGGTMCDQTWRPSVLNERSLLKHQTAIAHNPTRYPSYATTLRTAQQIQKITKPGEPIASLMVEPRLYYFAQRPPVYRLFHPQPVYSYLFDDFMAAVRSKSPEVIVARVPAGLTPNAAPQQIASAIFATSEAYFGDGAHVLRERYQVSEVIDELCILRPKKALRLHASEDVSDPTG